jgi:glycosyltransferase involved in cell wall biosynthesis
MAFSFSIVTCTWNSASYLDESIASVLAQDYPDIEYIFVDGGSTDGTLEAIHALPRPYRLIENIRGGVSRAMNVGMQAATGDIVAHLHADDYYLRPDALSTVARNLESSSRGWLFGRIMLNMDGALQVNECMPPRYSYTRLLESNFIPHPATFVRRELMKRVGGFDTNLRYAMDYDLWLKIGCLSEPVQLDEPLAMLREYEGSLFTRNRLAAMEEGLLVRLAHVGEHPLTRAMHYARYFFRRQRAMQAGTGK